MASTKTWPLTAAATAYLRDDRGTSGSDVLKLSLKELVLRRVWRLDRRERAGLVRSRVELILAPGGASPAPGLVPLAMLDERLRATIGPEGDKVEKAVQRVNGMQAELRRAVRDDLCDRGLLRLERSKVLGLVPRTRTHLTPEGEKLAAESHGQEETVRAALRGSEDPTAKAGLIVASGGVVLIAYPSLVPEIEEVYAQLAPHGGAGGAPYGDGGSGGEGLDAFDPGFDSAIDSGGGSDGGGGGDGGGGDGGGG